MGTVTSTASGNWSSDAASCWDSGSRAGNADDVVIASGHNITISQDEQANSLTVASGGTLTVSGERTITIDSENGSGFAVDIDGAISGDLNLTITTPATTSVDMTASSGKVHDLTINHASCTVNAETTVDITGNLNVTLGTFNANGNVLTVAGSISGNGTLNASTSTVTVTGQTTVATVNITTGTYNYFDDFRPTTCNITDNATFNQTSTGGQFGGRVIITASKTPTFNAVGRLHSSLDIQSGEQGNSTFNLDLSEDQTGPARHVFFHNLELDSEGTENNTLTMAGAITCTGDLTVTDGKIDTGSTGRAITVTGNVSVASGGALDLDAASSDANYSFGSLTIASGGEVQAPSHGTITITNKNSSNYIIQIAGLFTHNSGTVKIDTSVTGDKLLDLIPSSGVGLNNLIVNEDGSGVVQYNGNTTIAGDLTIEEGIFQFYDNNNSNLTVSGNVSIESGGQLGAAGWIGAGQFGSLTIATGGTYNATSGTTTITNRTSGGYSWYSPTTGSTFNHNNGKVKLAYTGNETYWQGTGFYDLEIAGHSAYEHRYDDLTDGSGLTIFNNFTITEGRVRFNQGGDNVTVHGLTKMSGGQYGNTGTAPSGTHNYLGGITMLGGAWQTTSGTLNTSGLRILGGTFA